LASVRRQRFTVRDDTQFETDDAMSFGLRNLGGAGFAAMPLPQTALIFTAMSRLPLSDVSAQSERLGMEIVTEASTRIGRTRKFAFIHIDD
jgi:hypothetical protein